jgi:hypothetical protein
LDDIGETARNREAIMQDEQMQKATHEQELDYSELLGLDQVHAVSPDAARPTRKVAGALLSKIGVGELTPN